MLVCLHECVYGKISKVLLGPPPSITNSEGNGERDRRWKERWRSPQKEASRTRERGVRGKMDGTVQAGSD